MPGEYATSNKPMNLSFKREIAANFSGFSRFKRTVHKSWKHLNLNEQRRYFSGLVIFLVACVHVDRRKIAEDKLDILNNKLFSQQLLHMK